MLFAALVLITAIVPVIAMAEIARMRAKAFWTYLGFAVLAVAGLAA